MYLHVQGGRSQIHMHTYSDANTHARMHTHTHKHLFTHTYILLHTITYVHMYTYLFIYPFYQLGTGRHTQKAQPVQGAYHSQRDPETKLHLYINY